MYFSKLLVSDVIEFASLNGADTKEICKSLDLNIESNINPKEIVSYDTMVALLNTTGQVLNDEHLGLHLGEQLMLKGTKQVDTIMQYSPTIEEAFSNAVNYSKLISDALESNMTKDENYTKISFEVNPDWAVLQSQAVQQIIDLTLVCTMKSIYYLTGRKYSPVEVHLSNPKLKKRNEYFRVFDCSVKFNESIPSIVFHNPVLDQELESYDFGLLAQLKKLGNEELENIQVEDPIILKIKKCILRNLPEKSSLEITSNQLNMSSRTLQRKLKDRNTNFKQIEKDILIKLAKKFLLYENKSIDQISYLLGFSEASAFIRFFKNETGITPRSYKFKELS